MGPASGTATAAQTTAAALIPPAVSPTFGNFTSTPTGIPSTPSVGNLTSGAGNYGGSYGGLYGGGGRSGGGLGGPSGITDQAGNPIYTPEQAYSIYAQSLGSAIQTTPQQQLLRQILSNAQAQAYNPNNISIGGPGGAGNTATSAYQRAQQAQAQAMQVAYPTISPYSTAYGTPMLQAPAPTPQWGYPTGYGQTPPGYSPSAPPAYPSYPAYPPANGGNRYTAAAGGVAMPMY